jgi:hypothetical protein
MAVQVTGFFQNPQSGLIYESPLLTLVPHLQYAGQIALDVLIIGAGGPTGAVGYQSIDKSTLTYDATITDAYSQLIDALDHFVIDNLKDATPINSNSVFTQYTPPAPVEPEVPVDPIVPEEPVV